MNGVEPAQQESALLRVLSGIAGVVVLLVSGLFTLGSALAAPLGMFVALRRARRKGRPLTRAASWLSAVFASIILLFVGLVVLFSFMPGSAWQEMQKGATEARVHPDTANLPAWMKSMPRSAQSDSMTNKLATNPGFFLMTFAIGIAFTCVFLGAIGGTAGWIGAVLLRFAFWGVRT
jgi:hypothetical protein